MATRRGPARRRDAVDEDRLTIGQLIERTGLSISAPEFIREVETVVGARRYRPVRVADAEPAEELDRSTRAALERMGADFTPFPADRSHPADVVRAAFAALRADSDAPDEVARHLGRDVSRVRQRIRDRTLWAITGTDGARLPRVQFEEDGTEIPGMGEVVAALPADLHPVAVFRFLTTTDPGLVLPGSDEPLSPRDWLRSGGQPDAVASIARDTLAV